MQVVSSSSFVALASQETTTPPPFHNLLDHGDDSELDIREVPDTAGRVPSSSMDGSVGKHKGRKKKAVAAEKEHNRMKRLLRNRVSAQQARERRKAYVNDLEIRIKEIEQRNAELEEKVSTLQQENSMLRKIIKNTSIRSDNASGVNCR